MQRLRSLDRFLTVRGFSTYFPSIFRLEEVAQNCPVALSLHPDVSLPMEFRYPAPS